MVSVFVFTKSLVRVEHTTSHGLLLYNSANSRMIKTPKFKTQLYFKIIIYHKHKLS